MMCEAKDIISVTDLLENSTQTSLFAEYRKIGVKILPLQSIKISETHIEEYLKEETE